jgi:hypothetical protein
MVVQGEEKKGKHEHNYYDNKTIENLARYFKIDQHPEMLFILKKMRKDGY